MDDGNCALHVLSAASRVNLAVALLLYQAAGAQGALLPNAQHFNPYNVSPTLYPTALTLPIQLAVVKNNRLMARFIFDMVLFQALPYWTPAVVSCGLLLALFSLLQGQGLLRGSLYWLAAHTLAGWTLSQHQVAAHRGRKAVGLFCGAFLSLCGSAGLHVLPFLGPQCRLLLGGSFLLSAYLLLAFCRSRPAVAREESLSSLAAKIVQASPQEGTMKHYTTLSNLMKHNKHYYLMNHYTNLCNTICHYENYGAPSNTL